MAAASSTAGTALSRSSRYLRPRYLGVTIRSVTAAVSSAARSSGGRSRVLSGTRVAPARITAAAVTTHSGPFGMSRPTREDFATPAATRRAARARLRLSSSAWLTEAPSPTPATCAVRPAEHLRELLVACGVLPAIDKQACLFERWLPGHLATIPDEGRAQVIRRFATWDVLPRLRARAERRPVTTGC
jgi:hypothetical protein